MRILFDLAALASLFFILRYRVHIHVSYSPRKFPRSSVRRRTTPDPEDEQKPVSAQMLADQHEQCRIDLLRAEVEVALMNLGASKAESRAMSAAAIAQGPGDFDTLLLRAMQSRPQKKARRSE